MDLNPSEQTWGLCRESCHLPCCDSSPALIQCGVSLLAQTQVLLSVRGWFSTFPLKLVLDWVSPDWLIWVFLFCVVFVLFDLVGVFWVTGIQRIWVYMSEELLQSGALSPWIQRAIVCHPVSSRETSRCFDRAVTQFSHLLLLMEGGNLHFGEHSDRCCWYVMPIFVEKTAGCLADVTSAPCMAEWKRHCIDWKATRHLTKQQYLLIKSS